MRAILGRNPAAVPWALAAAAAPYVHTRMRGFSRCDGKLLQERPTIYLIRHGEAEHNVVDKDLPRAVVFAQRRDPSLRDPMLTTTGVAQAQSAAKELASQLQAHGDTPPRLIVSSTLRRALRTAEVATMSVAASDAILVALDTACEIQFGDVWNEPRAQSEVAAEWQRWRVVDSGGRLFESCGEPPLETADDMVARAERVWLQLAEIMQREHIHEKDVVVLVAHGCFLQYFVRRLSVAAGEVDVVDQTYFDNAEVRRLKMPAPDGLNLQWHQLAQELAAMNRPIPPGDTQFWTRYSRRVRAINRASPATLPAWAHTEWRYAQRDEAFDAAL